MVVIRSKQHGPPVKISGGNGIDDGIGFSGSRRTLDIGKRILHGIVDRQKLIQIYPVVNQGDRIFLSPDRPSQQISKKGFDGKRHLSPVIHIQDSLVLPVQIHLNFSFYGDQIGHVIHSLNLAVSGGNPVFNPLLIGLKII